MKIDLHCHTKAIKKGDGDGRNVTPELFKRKIEDADVKIVAITNHNAFDIDQYRSLKFVVDGICMVWPGIEIDVCEPHSSRWHLIVVANPKQVELFKKKTDELFKDEDLDDCVKTIDEIYTAFRKIDAIYIAHFHGKQPSIGDKDRHKMENLVGKDNRFFMETSNEKSMGIYANYLYNVLVGSDVKDWNEYEKCSFSELKLPVDSFEQFCLLAKRDENVVQTILNKKEFKLLIAHPAENVDLKLKLYADINIIFGQKGTGKSQIIETLFKEMQARGLKCVKCFASKRNDNFRDIIEADDYSVDLDEMGIPDCKEDFELIGKWKDNNPTNFENYVKWKSTEGNNSNKTRMKITRATNLVGDEIDNEDVHKADLILINKIVKDLNKIKLDEYLAYEEIQSLENLICNLKNNIFNSRESDLINKYSVVLVNFTINKIKNIADKSTDSVSKPSTTGLIEFAENRLRLLAAINNILSNLSIKEINKKEKIGSLDEKGDIWLNTKYRMLCKNSKAKEFKIGINKLRKIISNLEEIKNHIFDADISNYIQDVNELLTDEKINSIEVFLGKSRQVLNEKGELYSPSNGEIGMLVLQRTLMQEADAYFLDEPELGMGNSYIDSTIRPILMTLAQRHKYVIVATHNANIAVRTLPYVSIYRTHGNGKYSTYVGNPFSNKLVNIEDKNDILNWAEESLKVLEGSHDAFYERKNIYESNNS